jgi:hypothetical protein
MQTIHVRLDTPEIRGLYSLAEAECRPLREQVRYMLRKALLERGLLPSEEAEQATAQPKEAASVQH